MELSEYTAALRQEVAAVTHMAGDDVARAGQMIAEALDSSIRLTLLDVLAGAAAEITARMDDADVELRLSAGDPTFVVVQGAPDLHPPVPPVPPFPPAPPSRGEDTDEGSTSRVTLRLPDGLKARAEAAAAAAGVSLNAWLVRAASQALDSRPGDGPPAQPGGHAGRRITGYARS